MTKLKWEKADEYCSDPGAVVEVPEITRPIKAVGPNEREFKRKARAERTRQLQLQSEQHDKELLEAGLERRIRARLAAGEELQFFDLAFLRDREGSN